MSKAPAFQFYPTDYLADGNVALMTLEEEGAYIRLLCYCWNEGGIPDDITLLARYCRVPEEKMVTIWSGIKKCFSPSIKDANFLMHPRLEKERKKQKDFQKISTERGRAGAKARWDKKNDECLKHAPSNAKAMLKNSFISPSSSSTSVVKTSENFSDDDFQTAEFIFEKVKSLNPSVKKPNLSKWANDVRLMVQYDKRTHQSIKSLFEWVNRHDFWKANILSPGKLREKWDHLETQRVNQGSTGASSKYCALPGNQIVPQEKRIGGELVW